MLDDLSDIPYHLTLVCMHYNTHTHTHNTFTCAYIHNVHMHAHTHTCTPNTCTHTHTLQAEDNWRNDYPDEDEWKEEEGEGAKSSGSDDDISSNQIYRGRAVPLTLDYGKCKWRNRKHWHLIGSQCGLSVSFMNTDCCYLWHALVMGSVLMNIQIRISWGVICAVKNVLPDLVRNWN